MELDKTTYIKSLEAKIEQLTQENYQLNHIISLMPGHVYWLNNNNVFLGCNALQAEHAGLSSPQEIVGKTNFDMPWKEQAKALNQMNDQVRMTGKAHVAEEYAVMADKPGVFLSHKVPLRNALGDIIGVLGISFDISERKEMEAELSTAKKSAEEASELKTSFIRNMEHDIRTPLAGIVGMANLLLETHQDAESQEYLGDIIQCTNELLDYCNAILDFSRIEGGYFLISEEKFKLKPCMEGVIKVEMPAAKHKHLHLALAYDDNVPVTIIGDKYRLQRLLLNLLSNAIKFTPKGEVKLSIKLVKKVANQVILSFIVSDTGIGIPKVREHQIYEKFSRLNETNQAIYQGFGLGLRIVKQFISEMNGEIEVESGINKGT